jgi:hypothetical protein
LGYADCRILATTHGFIEDDKKYIDEYKDSQKEYWSEIFENVGDGKVDFEVEDDGLYVEAPIEYSDQ